MPKPTSASKYRNKKTKVDGITFASKKEAKRYGELKLLEKAGKISDLTWQVWYPLTIGGNKICTYVADFVYTDVDTDATVVEDAKGVRTRDYIIKRKLMKVIYDITILET